MLDGRADVAVHSAKDLPPRTPAGLLLAAVPTRGDARDALVGSTLDGLRPGARVATGAARRRAQLANLRPGPRASSMPAGQHRDPGGQGRQRRRRRGGGGRGRPRAARACTAQAAEILSPLRHAPPGRPGRHRARVPRPTTALRGPAGRRSTTRRRTGRSRAERSMLAVLGASLLAARSGGWAEPDGDELRLRGMVASARRPGRPVHAERRGGRSRRPSAPRSRRASSSRSAAPPDLLDDAVTGMSPASDRLPGRRRARGPRAPDPRGAELLAMADVVVYDRLIDRSLLALAPAGAS